MPWHSFKTRPVSQKIPVSGVFEKNKVLQNSVNSPVDKLEANSSAIYIQLFCGTTDTAPSQSFSEGDTILQMTLHPAPLKHYTDISGETNHQHPKVSSVTGTKRRHKNFTLAKINQVHEVSSDIFLCFLEQTQIVTLTHLQGIFSVKMNRRVNVQRTKQKFCKTT